ncbi:TIM barrel protein [Paenibacillus sp. YYML68]|uniref:TIM barrel protein n=1 Tax=Paenibacillus sp. YYML68 TaxID=2909250 RepID=UPI002490F5A4|nr:TIM barrel protein [Paenibacillus sp. YYML68]
MNDIRLKTNLKPSNIADRLQYNPSIIEFYLGETDLLQPELIRERIRELQSKGIRVYLHHPPKVQGKRLDILSRDEEVRTFYHRSSEQLAMLCHEEDVRCVIHAHYSHTESSGRVGPSETRRMRDEIRSILEYGRDVFLWEDTIEGLFAYANPYLMEELVVPLNLPLNVDVSHTFISFRGDNDKLRQTLEQTHPYAQYYHLVDSFGLVHDSLPLGEGLIDWAMVKPYVADRDFIFEVGLAGDHSDCTPMIRSAEFFRSIQPIYR